MSLVLTLAAMALLAAGGAQAHTHGDYIKGCYAAAAVGCPDSHTECGLKSTGEFVCAISDKVPTGCPDELDFNKVERECGTQPKGGKGKGPKGPHGSKRPCLVDAEADCSVNQTACGPNEAGQFVCICDKDATECPVDLVCADLELEVVTKECGARVRACTLPASETECRQPKKNGLFALTCTYTDSPETITICVTDKDEDAECPAADELDELVEIPECGDGRKSEGDGSRTKVQNRRMQL
jgi:hypothetical protein